MYKGFTESLTNARTPTARGQRSPLIGGAAKILDLSADMVRLLGRNGVLPTAARGTGGVRLFQRSDVDGLAADRAGKFVRRHAVQYYESDEFLVGAVAGFIARGLRVGAAAIVIATAEHREAFSAQLARDGVDVQEASRAGRLTLVDARDTLASLMAGKTPDARRFRKVVGDLLRAARPRRAHVPLHAYGEMANLLWKDGHSDAAIRLEALWNDLARTRSFLLLCAYNMSGFRHRTDTGPFTEICEAHTRVIPTERFSLDNVDLDAWEREMARLQQLAAVLETESTTHAVSTRADDGPPIG